MDLTLTGYIQKVQSGALQPQAVVEQYVANAKADTHNAWVRLHEDYVNDHLGDFGSRGLCGAPIGIKDNILTKGYETTCSSKILQGYIPPYSATCFERLEQAGGLMLGKTNMDEFAMGTSTESSALGITTNPRDNSRIPGGSSGGSAAAVAADQCLAALGTETGGSVRQPAALCGLVGVKPTYGRISRYGVQAMAASVNQVGTITKTVEDSVFLLDAISGYDEKDAQSVDRGDEQQSWYDQLKRDTLQGMKFALPKQFLAQGLDPRIKEVCLGTIAEMRAMGAEVEEIDIPILSYVIPIYYIMVPAEVSSELARFDGMRFGLQDDTMNYDHIFDYYEKIRNEGFGDEVKRRIIVGSYVLSSGFYDAYYHKAQLAKQKMVSELTKVYKDFDAIIGPTTPSLAWKIGAKVDDPIQMYLEDTYTAVANVTGLPAISVPVGFAEDEGVKLPVGLQIMTKWWDEGGMFGIANVLEKKVGIFGGKVMGPRFH